MMISNAFLLSEKRVERLNDVGLQELQISVDGVHPNDVTVKVLKPLRKKLETIARVARFPVVLSGVLGAAPPSEVLEVVRFARDHGFRPRVLVLHDGEGQSKMTAEELAAYKEIRASIGGRFAEAGDYRTGILETGNAVFKCRAGSRYLYVDEHGVVHWCSQTRGPDGIPLEQYGFEDLVRAFETEKSCAPKCTIGCARTQSAPDEWRAQPRRDRVRLPVAPP
jgi:MoaA/NifB/PqqE/SkfB family radical SAM enzyme